MSNSTECPFCHKSFPLHSIHAHVEVHFVDIGSNIGTASTSMDRNLQGGNELKSNSTLGNKPEILPSNKEKLNMDEMIAKQLEQEEIKKMHEVRLGKLKAEESSRTFLSQSIKSMEAAVDRHKLTTTEYFSRKFDLMEALDAEIDDSSTCTPFLSDLLVQYIQTKTNHSSQGSYLLLIYHASHFGAGYGDTGWGCGFRNLQMMFASLYQLPLYQHALSMFKRGIPSIPKLQKLIEKAWEAGFDPSGREQLNGRLYSTSKWIGATEVFTLLSSLKLHCRIIDFHEYTDLSNKLHPALFDWVQNYFNSSTLTENNNNMVRKCNIPIIYLQHKGHSRSVVGVQCNAKRPTHLVLFDPSHTKQQLVPDSDSSHGWSSPDFFLKPLSAFKERQYQVVCVCGLASDGRYNSQKDVDRLSEKIP